MSDERTIRVGEDHDGDPVELPAEDVLTGRSFVTGKSGSGKSNSVSVVIEELLEEGFPVLVVDTDGEYYGLKEEYEILHAGADEECDIQVSSEHAEKIASLALEENVPVILDVSGYLDEDEADDLIRETARHLFAKEKKLKKPFLLVVEEIHEYVPEGAGMGETGQMLIKVGKRGRKHGLGIVGISQRPADVKKDFITQANWLVWHRLTWENDTKVVGRIVGTEYAEAAAELDDGQAFLQRDWTDDDVTLVQFDRKRTFDAGATPGLEDFERPELKSVSDSLVDDLQEITEAQERKQDRIEELEDEIEAKNDRIEELEEELQSARNVSQAAKRMADALTEHVPRNDEPFGYEERLRQKNERIEELNELVESREETIRDLKAQLAEATDHHTFNEFEIDDVGDGADDAHGADDADGVDDADLSGQATSGAEAGATRSEAGDSEGTSGSDDRVIPEGALEEGIGVPERDDSTTGDAEAPGSDSVLDADGDVEEHVERLRRKGERLLAADEDAPRWQRGPDPAEAVGLLHEEAVVDRVEGAIRESQLNRDHAWSVVASIAARGALSLQDLVSLVGPGSDRVATFLSELRSRSLVTRDDANRYSLDARELRRVVESDERPIDDPGRQWAVDD